MGFQLAEAYVQLSQKGFGSVMGGINAIKGKLGSLASFATGPVAMGLGALGAGAGLAGMVKLAASAEATETQFKTLLGSVDGAKSMIADLQKFGASTPFEFPGLAESAKKLLAFGVSSDQIIPTMQVLGDVAAATGNDIGELSQIYGKVKSSGRLMTESLDQFNERGVPVAKILAESMGKSGEEIRKMASEGKLSFGDLQKALTDMNSQGGIAFGGMEAQSKTLGGLWSTLSDNVTMLMTSIGTALVEGFDLKGIVANFSDFVGRVQGEWMPSIVESIRWVKDNMVEPFASAIGSMVTYLADFVRDFDLYWEYAYTSLGNQMNNIYQVVSTAMVNAWTITKWYFSNFFDIAANVFSNLPTLFMKYVEFIIGQWKSVLNFFSTGKIEIDWSPLQDAAKLIFKDIEMPRLETAQTDALRSDLDRISGQIASRQAARAKQNAQEEKKATAQKADALAIEEKSTETEEKKTEEKKKQTDEAKKQQAGFVGIAELANQMQQANFGNKPSSTLATVMRDGGSSTAQAAAGQRGQVDSLSRQVTVLESLLALATGSGLKVSPLDGSGGIKLPAASVAFGAQGG